MVRLSELPGQPFVSKTASEILGEILEHIVTGVVKVDYEQYTYNVGTDTYALLCGSPDISTGLLVEINRIWGIIDGSFYEFIENVDFSVDTDNNEITFTNTPDDTTDFFVNYRYNQQFTSSITDVSDGSVTRVLMTSVSRQFASMWKSLELLQAAAWIDTALGDDLDEVLKLVGVERNEATVASGYITYYRETTAGQTLIPAGSLVGSQRTDQIIIYQTTENAYFQDGFGTARAPIEAQDAYSGKKSNMAPDRITRIISGGGGASRCNNPQYYNDYEFHTMIEGKYTYDMGQLPVRVINSQGLVGNTSPPWSVNDNGIVSVLGFRDASMQTANWSTNNIDISEDDPESGQLLCTPSTTVDAYIQTTLEVNLHTYPHAFIMIRGTVDDEFNVDIEADSETFSVEFYEFGSTSSTTQGLANLNWTLFVGALFRPIEDCISRLNTPPGSPAIGDRYVVGPAPTDAWSTATNEITEYDGSWNFTTAIDRNIVFLNASTTTFDYYRHDTSLATVNQWTSYSISTSTFNIILKEENDYWIDFVGVGRTLEEISGVALSSEDQNQINYTSKVFGLWYVDENNNFFQKYDGDDSDGKVDFALVYYKWNNHISGGGDRESDDALRIRGRTALQVAAKGTKEALKNAILEIDGINQCEIADYNDDITIAPGIFHVYVSARGFTVSPSLNQEIVDVVDDVRAAGTQGKIFTPQVRYVNFVLNVVYDDSLPDYVGDAGLTTLRNIVSSAIDDFFADSVINDPLYFHKMIGFLIQEVRGLESAFIDWDDSTTPETVDDDFDGTYSYDSDIMLTDPQRITGVKADATVVVQRGQGVTTSSFNLFRKSDKR